MKTTGTVLCRSSRVTVALAMALAGGLSSMAPTAQAAVFELPGDGSWLEFYVAEGVPSWLDAASDPASFTFTSTQSFTLRVVDFFLPGDSTSVFANGSLLGATPEVAFDDSQFADSAAAAFGQPAWSQASWALEAGSYTFTGTAGSVPLGAGAFAISVAVAAVPEPSAVVLMLAGLAFIAGRSARRRRSLGGA
jgi:hypothetical protein